MTLLGNLASRRRQILSILGMAMVWPSIHNQVLYPLTFSFHKDGAVSPYAYYLLYSLVMLITVVAVLLMGRKQITCRLFTNKWAIVSIGIMGAIGLSLLVACNFESYLAYWFMGVGVAFSAVFVPIYFMFWSVQIVYSSKKRAAFDLIISYIIFSIITLLRLTFALHAWMFSIAYPLISAALAVAVLAEPAKSKYALGSTPLSGLPQKFLIPSIAFVYLGTAARCLLNPSNAAFDYPPYHRLLIYVTLIGLGAVLALLYRPHGKLRRNADTLGFTLVTVLLIGAILLTSIGLVTTAPLGNLPIIAGINIVELFIWLIVLVNAQIKHAGIIRPAAIFLVLVVGASHLITALVLGGVSLFQFDVSQLPLIVITVVLAFLVVTVVMTVLAIMLYNAHSQQPEMLFSPAAASETSSTSESTNSVQDSTATTATGSASSPTPATNRENLPPCFTMAADEAAITRIRESFGLSKRETDTLRLAARNKSTKEIADNLYVAESTVHSHIKGIYRKCDVHSRQELIALVNRFKREQPY